MSMFNRIKIIQADIATLNVDVIVNAANRALSGGGGVDGVIHRAAGPELLQACRQLGWCETGQAKITPGFRLSARYVIHAVGPVWQGGDKGEPELLASCYRESLRLARQHDVKTIAFPAISTGAYGYPLKSAAKIAIHEVVIFLEQDQSLEIVFLVCFDHKAYETYLQMMNEYKDDC